jgi:7-cyano-7-deazaguanine tRNA-ribosyltransferase
MGFYFFAIGSPVELMESYNFSILAQLIKTTKMAIPDKPIHLFGAGHPLTIPLAVALGCDTFDSASYILYAKDNRYMYSHGTLRLEDLSYFPCCCPVCSYYTVKELLNEDKETKIINLAKHNLFILKQEISFVKQSIYDGRLWEYVLQKSRSHPKLRDAIYQIKDFDYLQNYTPLFKQKAIYLFEPLDQYRPELKNFRHMLINNYKPFFNDSLLLYPDLGKRPFYLSTILKNLIERYSPSIVCLYNPFFGLIPVEISDVYPASHNVISTYSGTFDAGVYNEFIKLFNSFIKNNLFKTVFIIADYFMKRQLPFLQFPDKVEVKIEDFIDYDKDL